jgi:hypothetical protein
VYAGDDHAVRLGWNGARGARGAAAGGDAGAHVDATACGNFNGDASLSASDALGILRTAIGSSTCLICICDVDNTASITGNRRAQAVEVRGRTARHAHLPARREPDCLGRRGDGYSWTNADNWSLNRIPNCLRRRDDRDGRNRDARFRQQRRAHDRCDFRSRPDGRNADAARSGRRVRPLPARGATFKNADVVLPSTAAPLVLTNAGGTLDGVSVATD